MRTLRRTRDRPIGRGQTKMVQYLLSKGAKPTSNALQYARTRGHKDIEKILIDAGAKE